jgi:hypothetical protein
VNARARDAGNEDQLLTASEIAALAGVGPSAVSNWRKRFPEFPQPAATAPSGGDLFDAREVTSWLGSRGRAPRQAEQTRLQLWAAADRLRGKTSAANVVGVIATAAAFVHLVRRRRNLPLQTLRGDALEVAEWVRAATAEFQRTDPHLDDLFAPLVNTDPQGLRILIDAADQVESEEELAAAVDAALDRATRYGEFRTPRPITDLVMELAEPHGVVLDPAVGSAEFLVRASETNASVETYGQEVNSDTWRLAVSRLLLRNIEPRIARGDSLTEDAYPQLRADLVVCDPPWGMRMPDTEMLRGDPRWRLLGSFDRPPSTAGDFAWVAHAIHHLREGGRGYLLLPAGSLFRGGTAARMRAELIRQGTIETIIALPGIVWPTTTAPATLWIVRGPTPNPQPLLLIDAQDEKDAIDVAVRTKIVETVRAWRREPAAFKASAGFATAVPVLELLAGDAFLLPSRWVYETEPIDTEATLAEVRSRVEELRVAHALVPAMPRIDAHPADNPPERFRVRDLIDNGLATLLRPARLKREQYADEGLPVWEPADVRPSWQREESPQFARPEDVDQRSVTQPGDIVFTTIGGLRARVDDEGGHVLGTSLHALRLDSNLFDPHAVAELLPTEQNRRLSRGTIPRINVLELEIPQLTPDDAEQFKRLLTAIERDEEAGQKIVAAAAALRDALREAVSAGRAAVRGGSEPDE